MNIDLLTNICVYGMFICLAALVYIDFKEGREGTE